MDGEGSRGGGPPRFKKLDEDYRGWSAYCKAYLVDRGVWTAVESPRPVAPAMPLGASVEDANAAKIKADKAAAVWDRKNEVALSNIMMGVEVHLVELIDKCTTAADAWETLREMFEDDLSSRRADLELELSVLALQAGESIVKYVTRAKGLRNSLAVAGVRVDDHSLVLHVLRGLPSGYDMIKTVLHNKDGPMRLATVSAKLLHTEKTLAAEGGGSSAPKGQAFTTKGYKREQAPASDKAPEGCFYCGKPGHYKRECRKLVADRAKKSNGRKGGGGGGHAGDKKVAFVVKADKVGAVSGSQPDRPNRWVVDSGATHHMATGHGKFVAKEGGSCSSVTLASGAKAPVLGSGTAQLRAVGGGKEATITLQDAFHVPQLQENLLSVAAVDQAGGAVLFTGGKCYIYEKAAVVGEPTTLDKADAVGELDPQGQYSIGEEEDQTEGAMLASAPVTGAAVLLHRRFNHLGYDNLRRLVKMVDGMDAKDLEMERVAGAICRPCVEGKMTRAPFPASETTAEVMELVHSDVSGPFPRSLGGSRYFVTLLEPRTGIKMAVPIAKKSDVGVVIQMNIPILERASGKKVKRFRTDGAKEYKTKRLNEWYARKGITHEETLPYSPESNGVAERVNRTIKERARAALIDANAPEELWAEAVAASVYVLNRSPCTGQDVTPWEALTGVKPDVSNIRVWGSKAYALKPAKQQRGLNSKTVVGIMVGYSQSGKGYRVYKPTTKEVVERRDVVMDETAPGVEPVKKGTHVSWADEADDGRAEGEAGQGEPAVGLRTPFLTPSSSGASSTSGGNIEAAIDAARRLAAAGQDDDSEDEVDEPVERYPGRERAPPARFGQANAVKGDGGGAVETKDTLPPPPKTVKEAMSREDWPLWKVSLDKEKQSMRDNKVWRKQKAPAGAKVLKAQVLFDYKFKQDGKLDRRKCRIVGGGHKQRPGRDFFETMAPVPAAASTRMLLATAAARGWHVHHVDVRTAYLNAPMDVEVYITIPDGFEDAGEEALLLQAIYGAKQAGHLWGEHFGGTLKDEGAVQAEPEPCIFVLEDEGNKTLVEVYVDDGAVAGKSLEAVEDVKRMIGTHYKIRDLGRVNDYTGMEVRWDDEHGTVSLANPRHTAALLADFGMEDCKPCATPMAKGTVLGEGEPLEAGNRFAELLGSIMYIANQTRPDLAFAVGVLARRMASPTTGDMVAAKHVLRYLRGTKTMGIRYGGDAKLAGWVDADWAGDPTSRKSTTGFVFTMHGGPISWRSRLQGLVTGSTADAEFVAASEAAKESLWLRRLAGVMGEDSSPVTIKEDNQACIGMATNYAVSPRSKHVDVRRHQVRDFVKRGEVTLEYVPTGDQLADGFTKALEGPAFKRFREAVGVCEVDAGAGGR